VSVSGIRVRYDVVSLDFFTSHESRDRVTFFMRPIKFNPSQGKRIGNYAEEGAED